MPAVIQRQVRAFESAAISVATAYPGMDERSKVLVNLLASGVSGGIGAALTNPLEVLKVRFQVSPPGGGVTMRAFARDVVAAEGAWRGLCTPGLSANAWFIGVSSVGRVGLYPYARDAFARARCGEVGWRLVQKQCARVQFFDALRLHWARAQRCCSVAVSAAISAGFLGLLKVGSLP